MSKFDISMTTLVGRVGQPPEFRATRNGNGVCNFTLATETGTGDFRETRWHKIVVWGALAETIANNVEKGDPLIVIGETRTRSYLGKTGEKIYTTETHGNYVAMQFIPEAKNDG